MVVRAGWWFGEVLAFFILMGVCVTFLYLCITKKAQLVGCAILLLPIRFGPVLIAANRVKTRAAQSRNGLRR